MSVSVRTMYYELNTVFKPCKAVCFHPACVWRQTADDGILGFDYWVPGHKEAMHGWTTVIYHDGWPQYQYNDWWMFYYGANITFQAEVDGCPYPEGNSKSVVFSGSGRFRQ